MRGTGIDRKPRDGHSSEPPDRGVIAFYALVGGALGWWTGTKAIYRRSSHGFDDVEISPETLARRKLWRLVRTLVGLLGGALVGLAFLLVLARR